MDGFKFYRQYSVGRYILDFFCPAKRLAVELDGGHHAEDIHKQQDTTRTAYLVQNHIHVLQFWNNEVMQNLEGVWQKMRIIRNVTNIYYPCFLGVQLGSKR